MNRADHTESGQRIAAAKSLQTSLSAFKAAEHYAFAGNTKMCVQKFMFSLATAADAGNREALADIMARRGTE